MHQFLTDFFVNVHKIENDNWDHIRFAGKPELKQNFMIDRAVNWMQALISNKEQFEQAYHMLADERSRKLMLSILQFDILDHHHVRLPLNTPEYWPSYHSIDARYLIEKNVTSLNNLPLNLYNLSEQNIKILCNPLGILTIFLLKQYFFQSAPFIQPEPGDVCIDGGGCSGDVALNFANTVGSQGHVHSFEFVENNLSIFQKNIQLNPDLEKRITIEKKALWNKSGEQLSFDDRGPSTSVTQNSASAFSTKTITIDDYVEEKKLKSLDFIKMDIEGAEVQALQGAWKTIQTFKPKLAICVYHKTDDLFKIPFLVKEIVPEYKLYLDHFTIHREETVLFAKVE